MPRAATSPFTEKPSGKAVPWIEVFSQVSKKIGWESLNDKYDKIDDRELRVRVVAAEDALEEGTLQQSSLAADVVVVVGFSDAWMAQQGATAKTYTQLVEYLQANARAFTQYDSDGFKDLEKYGIYVPSVTSKTDNPIAKFMDNLYQPSRGADEKAYSITGDMWKRMSMDDLIFMIFVLVDSFANYPIKSVKSMTSSDDTSLGQVGCMCSNCPQEMIDCFGDETCRQALACLDKCQGNDQVCQYRCITSYETIKFEKFALCILQKNNCMGNSASRPVYPDPPPLPQFRGNPLTFQTAEDIFIGHLRLREGESNPLMSGEAAPPLLPWSWKVVCGQNPAYDYFACQHQLFYRDKKRPTKVWYDPVFKVTTLGGEEVWRRRHYRVRNGKVPGQFYFSVLDNGVVSDEYWRILDSADDLSWGVFYYAGAASAAGTSYTGALVVTPDGEWPEMTEETSGRIRGALLLADITLWELYEVENEY